ncbi:hypothetical protein PRIPAC_84503 [Pristionchus pacificus]|uniref:Uncharacterized protein n=1 Tax=Pristionchus pacificus TaxID=54126 RepID=A0A2A6BRU8_PRIPA|nr:hypothetical protein PRIPAC_84503 [Pristionchus pacificus]|eukprot:PDM68644.1 hypothetical protein PRIPAC_46946 [Pristionchus pacificus]
MSSVSEHDFNRGRPGRAGEMQRREEILRLARERRDEARKRYEDHAEQMLAADGVFNPSYEQIRAKLDEEACFLKPLVRRYKGVKYPDSPSPTTSDEDIRASLPTLSAACLDISYVESLFIRRTDAKYGDHNVGLLIAFALIIDLLEFRINFVIVSDLQYKEPSRYLPYVSGSLVSCTLAEFVYYTQFLITSVEMIVSIHYFIVRFCGKVLTVVFIYGGLGIVFVMAAGLLAATFAFGSVSVAYIYCTRAYILEAQMRGALLLWLATLFVAPILCSMWIVKAFITKQRYSGVTAFILSSSSTMSLLVLSFIFRKLAWRASYYHVSDPWYVSISNAIFALAYYVHEFRLLILCVLAISLVREIRGAVVATVMIAVRKVLGRPEPSLIVSNEVFLEGIEVNEKDNNNAIPVAPREVLLM